MPTFHLSKENFKLGDMKPQSSKRNNDLVKRLKSGEKWETGSVMGKVKSEQ